MCHVFMSVVKKFTFCIVNFDTELERPIFRAPTVALKFTHGLSNYIYVITYSPSFTAPSFHVGLLSCVHMCVCVCVCVCVCIKVLRLC